MNNKKQTFEQLREDINKCLDKAEDVFNSFVTIPLATRESLPSLMNELGENS